MDKIEDKFDLDDPKVDIKSVLEFINANGLSDKIKMGKNEKQDL